MQAIVLAAGKGTRMRSRLPKVLHRVLGKPLLEYVLACLADMGVRGPKVVIGYGAEEVRSFLREAGDRLNIKPDVVHQRVQLGTGHAVMMAEGLLAGSRQDILIWPGDMPLVKRSTLEALIREHEISDADVSVLSSLQVNPAGYGRILRAGGHFYAIREELDATEAERRVQEVNTGVYLFKAAPLFSALKKIKPTNRKNEFYLTDVIEMLVGENRTVSAFPLASSEEGQGINDRKDLAGVIKMMGMREIQQHMEKGVTFVAPEQTFVAKGVTIGADTVIYPWCYIESGVKIGCRCEIGPFAKIRAGSMIDDGSAIGSFVEVNRSKIGKKVNAKHLAYLGDAVIGDGTNVGAGTITANFDGVKKNKTRIGKNVLIGSDTIFVAPVTVADSARTGAGAVVTRGSKIKTGEVFVGVPARPLKTKRK